MIKWTIPFSTMQIAWHMLAYLDGQSLLRIAALSRWWRDVSEDERVWHALCVQLNISMKTGKVQHTFAVVLHSVDSADTRFVRVHAACPSKAVYMSYQCRAMNWRRRQVVARTRDSG